MPLVPDTSHQKRTVKFNGATGKQLGILKKARRYPINRQRFYLPVKGAQFQAIIFAELRCGRIAERTCFKKMGGFFKRLKDRAGRQVRSQPSLDTQPGLAILALQRYPEMTLMLGHFKPGVLMQARE
jgi:hypothetical protein